MIPSKNEFRWKHTVFAPTHACSCKLFAAFTLSSSAQRDVFHLHHTPQMGPSQISQNTAYHLLEGAQKFQHEYNYLRNNKMSTAASRKNQDNSSSAQRAAVELPCFSIESLSNNADDEYPLTIQKDRSDTASRGSASSGALSAGPTLMSQPVFKSETTAGDGVRSRHDSSLNVMHDLQLAEGVEGSVQLRPVFSVGTLDENSDDDDDGNVCTEITLTYVLPNALSSPPHGLSKPVESATAPAGATSPSVNPLQQEVGEEFSATTPGQ